MPVLIETLWNVKVGWHERGRYAGSGINRNIVECKVTIFRLLRTGLFCINRNIVECKDSSKYSCFGLDNDGVLIETLWNVKSEYTQNDIRKNRVLIETLWNVK